MEKLYIVMPAYNEEANINEVVQEWHPVVEKHGTDSRLAIFNDGSKDSTLQVLTELQKEYPLLEVVDKPNSGHGATCLYAYEYALNKGADYIFQTDSDGQTLSSEFYPFWDLKEEYDFIIGSRKGREDGISRIFVTKVLKLVLFICFGAWVEDANTPFRLINGVKLKKYMEYVPKNHFLSNIILTILFKRNKEKMLWKPITFRPRQGGINSINLRRIFKIGITAFKDFVSYKVPVVK